MTARWAVSPHSVGRWHALDAGEAVPGVTVTRCGLSLPTVDLVPCARPDGALCPSCAIIVGSEMAQDARHDGEFGRG